MGLERPKLHGEDHMNGVDPIPGLLRGISVTDGTSTVDPTTTETFDPTAFDVSGSPPNAAVALNAYAAYTPVLTADTVNPTKGSGSTVLGRWVRRGKFIHAYGNVRFGGSPALGTGIWSLTLPIANAMGSVPLGIAYLITATGSSEMKFVGIESGVDDSHFSLDYQTAVPIGAQALFGSTSGWTLANGDVLFWNFTYETT